MHIGQGCPFGHLGGSVTRTNLEIMSLAGSTPTIDPLTESPPPLPLTTPELLILRLPPLCGGGGGGGAVAKLNTSSLPREQSSRSETDPMRWLMRLRSLLLLSWLKYVDTVSTLGRRLLVDFRLLVSESINGSPPLVLDRLLCIETLRWWRYSEDSECEEEDDGECR